MNEDRNLELPEGYWLRGNQPVEGGREQVLEMYFHGKLVRARRAQWRYEYFRPAATATDAWFEGWTGKDHDPWVRLPKVAA